MTGEEVVSSKLADVYAAARAVRLLVSRQVAAVGDGELIGTVVKEVSNGRHNDAELSLARSSVAEWVVDD